MSQATSVGPVKYITNKWGDRIGVLLDLEISHRLANPLTEDTNRLKGLEPAELRALAEIMLAPSAQSQLDKLLSRNTEAQLSESEEGRTRPTIRASRRSHPA